MMTSVEDLIAMLDLRPLPGEGGFFRQTWAAPARNGRPPGTAILYLVTPDSFSALHRLDADEVFHFYLGNPCEQVVIDPEGSLETAILGPDILAGQHVQTVVPSGCWQGTRLLEGGEWALIGTTMAPGYDQAGFTLATSADLLSLQPEIAGVATRYLAEQA